MSFDEMDLLQYRRWEQSLVNDSPEPHISRYLVIEAGSGGMRVLVMDRWEDGDGNLVSRTVFRTHFDLLPWMKPGFRMESLESAVAPCNESDLPRVSISLEFLDKVVDGKTIVERVLWMCYIGPAIESRDGGWLKKYAPRFYAYHENRLLLRRAGEIREILDA